MTAEAPDPIEKELYDLEDKYAKDKLDALHTLADAVSHTRKFIVDNGDTGLNTTFRSPSGEVFNVDMLPYLPDMILEVAKTYYKQLQDVGKATHARQVLRRVERKWKLK